MKKFSTLKMLTAILAVAFIFFACKKEAMEEFKNTSKSSTANVGGVYTDFDKTATYYVGYEVTTFNPISTSGNTSFYNIFTRNVATGDLYSSFCGNVGSTGFGGDANAYTDKTEDFKIVQHGMYDKIMNALNYVCENYGGLDVWVTDGAPANKTIAGMVIHAILGDLEENVMNDEWRWGVPVDPAVNAAVAEVLANYASYNGTLHVTEFVYLAGPNYPADAEYCQPQIIPLYIPEEINNCEYYIEQLRPDFQAYIVDFMDITSPLYTYERMKDLMLFWLTYVEPAHPLYNDVIECLEDDPYDCVALEIEWAIAKSLNNEALAEATYQKMLAGGCIPFGPAYGTVTATKEGNVPNILGTLNPKNGNAVFPASYDAFGIVYNSNHFCFAKVTRTELENGVTLDMVVGNKIDIIGKATAQLVGGNIVFEIEKFGKGEFGVLAFNKPMTDKFPKNGNIHSQSASDLMNNLGATTGFNHDNKLTVPCPSGDDIYLYIHCGTIQFYKY